MEIQLTPPLKVRGGRGRYALLALLCLFFTPTAAHASGLTKTPNNLGLIYYAPMSEATSTKLGDFSGNGNTGTLTNFASPFISSSGWTTSKTGLGTALTFDGTDDFVDAGSSSLYDFTSSDFSTSFWVKLNADAGNETLLSHGEYNVSGWYIAYESAAVRLYTNQSGAAQGSQSSGSVLPLGQWKHVVVVRTGSTATYYIDGANATAYGGNHSNPTSVTRSLTVGAYNTAGFGSINGSIDEVRIYNRALSATEVATLYGQSRIAHPKNTTNVGLIGYWLMNEGTGATTADGSGQGALGTLTPGAGGTNTTVAQMWTTSGKFGKGISFDGTDDYVVGSNTGVAITNKTLSAWVKLTNTSQTGGGLVTYEVDDGSSFDSITYNETSQGWGFGSNNYFRTAWSGVAETSTDWIQMVATYENNNYKLYRNGVELLSTTSYSAYTYPTTSRLLSGKRHTGVGANGFLNAIIDDVRIYNRALSAGEVSALYAQTSTAVRAVSNKSSAGAPGLANLVLWHTFDGNKLNTTTSTDSSGQGNNGTLTNGPVPAIGKVGQALNFDGTNDYVAGGILSPQLSTAVTVSAWIKTSSSSGAIFMNGRDPNHYDPEFGFQLSAGAIFYWDYDGDYGFSSAVGSSSATVNDGLWHHVAFTKNGTAGVYYVDGAQSGTKTAALNANYSDSIGVWTIGRDIRDGSSPFPGTIDDVRIYNKALSAAEVLALYNQGK